MNFEADEINPNQMIIERLAEIQKFIAEIDSTNFEATINLVRESIFLSDISLFFNFYIIFLKTALSSYSKIELYISFFKSLLPSIKKLNINKKLLIDANPFAANLISAKDDNVLTPNDIFANLNDASPENMLYFLPELGKSVIRYIKDSYLCDKYQEFVDDFQNGKFEDFRNQGVNQDPLARIIRLDLLDEFEKLNEDIKITPETTIKYSIYEKGKLVSDPVFRPTAICYAAYFGSEKIFHYLFSSYEEGDQLLMSYALLGNNREIIEEILSKNYKFDYIDCISFIKNVYLEDAQLDESVLTNSEIFANSICSLNFDLISKYQKYVDINETNDKGENLFQTCYKHAEEESLFAFEFLDNVDYFHKDNNGRTVVHDTAIRNDNNLMMQLAELPCFDPNSIDNNNMSPLAYSIQYKNLNSTLILLDNKEIELNRCYENGPLIFNAIYNYDERIFGSILFKEEISIIKTNDNCYFPIEYCMKVKNNYLYKKILNHMDGETENIIRAIEKPLIEIIIDNSINCIYYLREAVEYSTMNLTKKDKNKLTPLQYAMLQDSSEVKKVMMKAVENRNQEEEEYESDFVPSDFNLEEHQLEELSSFRYRLEI